MSAGVGCDLPLNVTLVSSPKLIRCVYMCLLGDVWGMGGREDGRCVNVYPQNTISTLFSTGVYLSVTLSNPAVHPFILHPLSGQLYLVFIFKHHGNLCTLKGYVPFLDLASFVQYCGTNHLKTLYTSSSKWKALHVLIDIFKKNLNFTKTYNLIILNSHFEK